MADDVGTRTSARGRGREPRAHAQSAGAQHARGGTLAGGTEGNERLTGMAGVLLIVLLAALGITIVRIGQLLWWHLFLGLLLLGPVVLKMASTGYRLLRYYTRDRLYRLKGPPPPALRGLAPLVVGLTVVVFASGVVLLFVGPGASSRQTIFLIHKVSFFGWLAVTGLHVLGHLPEVMRLLRLSGDARRELGLAGAARATGSARPIQPPGGEPLEGAGGRWLALGAALVAGLVLAAVLIPDFGSWTSAHALFHHHHRFH